MEPCPFCPDHVDQGRLDSHILLHHPHLCFDCKICSKKVTGEGGPLFISYEKANEHQVNFHGRFIHGLIGIPEFVHSSQCTLCSRRFHCQSSKVISQHLRKDHSQLVATDISTIVDKYARLTCRLCNFSSTKVGLWMDHFQRGPYGRTFCHNKSVGGSSSQKDHRGLNVTSSQPVQENTITGSESNSEAHSRARIPSKTKALSRSSRSRSRRRSRRRSSSSSYSSRSSSNRSRSSRSQSTDRSLSSQDSRRERRRHTMSSRYSSATSSTRSASLDSYRTHETVYDYETGVYKKRKIYGFMRQPSKGKLGASMSSYSSRSSRYCRRRSRTSSSSRRSRSRRREGSRSISSLSSRSRSSSGRRSRRRRGASTPRRSSHRRGRQLPISNEDKPYPNVKLSIDAGFLLHVKDYKISPDPSREVK